MRCMVTVLTTRLTEHDGSKDLLQRANADLERHNTKFSDIESDVTEALNAIALLKGIKTDLDAIRTKIRCVF